MTDLSDELQQYIHAAVDEAVVATINRQRSQHPRFVPGTIQSVSGPIAKVIPDDALVDPEYPEQFVEAVRLDWAQGVHGGVIGDRNRTILMTIPGGAAYCLGAIPAPGEAFDVATDPESFFTRQTVDSARAPGVDTDMVITMDVTENHLYGIHLHSAAVFAAAGTEVECWQDGALIGRFWQENALGNYMIDAWVVFEAFEDIDGSSFTVRNAAGSGGNITMSASAAPIPRTLMGVCFGPTRRAVPAP